jgi:hypothetical protein
MTREKAQCRRWQIEQRNEALKAPEFTTAILWLSSPAQRRFTHLRSILRVAAVLESRAPHDAATMPVIRAHFVFVPVNSTQKGVERTYT